MSVFSMGTNKAINFSIKIKDTHFNFKHGLSLNIERHIGDTMNKFSISVIDGEEYKSATNNIDMLINNGARDIILRYGYGTSLITMKGFIVDYKHTFVGDIYQLEISGYVSLSTSESTLKFDSNVAKYYIDWGPNIPKRLDEGRPWDAFYTAIQSGVSVYSQHRSIQRFTDFYNKYKDALADSVKSEWEYEDLYRKTLENLATEQGNIIQDVKKYNSDQFWWGWHPFSYTKGEELNEQTNKRIQDIQDTLQQLSKDKSYWYAANNIVGMEIRGPKGNCWVPYPDLFIQWDETDPYDLDADNGMCDIWAFGLNRTIPEDKGDPSKGFGLADDWGQMVKKTGGKTNMENGWKLRVMHVDNKNFLWVGDVPENIDQVKGRADGPDPNGNTKKRWLTAAYNSATVVRDSAIRVSDIVKNLCDLEGWEYIPGITIVDTSYTNAADDTLRMNGEGAFQYIVEKLCPIAVDEKGRKTNYKAWFDNQNKFHFEPLAVTKPKDKIQLIFGYNRPDSGVLTFQVKTAGITIASQRNDSSLGINSSTGEGTQCSSNARDFKSALVSVYDTGADDYYFFNESLYNTLGYNSSKSSYEYFKSLCNNGVLKEAYVDITTQNKHLSSVRDNKDTAVLTANSMKEFEKTTIQAEMVIIGNPNIKPNRWIDIINYVKGGHRHYTSGEYYIQSVTDIVSDSGFTQKLELTRFSETSTMFQDEETIAEVKQRLHREYTLDNPPLPDQEEEKKKHRQEYLNSLDNAMASNRNPSNTTSGSGNYSHNSNDFELTAYCSCHICCHPYDPACTGNPSRTATGTAPAQGRTIAVDKTVIPLGSKVKISGTGSWDGEYIAEDTGGAIKGHRIDVYFSNHQDALNFGRKHNIQVSW